MGLTFEQVWASIQESNRRMEEMNRELNRAIGTLGNKFGDLVEHLIKPNLIEKFNALGYVFTKAGPQRCRYQKNHRREGMLIAGKSISSNPSPACVTSSNVLANSSSDRLACLAPD
ncbi:hypothetical protein FACS1894172_12720 [Spirochaetia bacterium]|nr:hypothetical protein FACS1894172_12720 [Spirochaetia bacterium]